MSTYITKYARENNLKKVDAKSNLLITLNQTDISKSKVKNSKNCAFACAVKRQVPGVKSAFFFRSTAWLEYETKLVKYKLPSSVQKEIVAFDRTGRSETGVYHLATVCRSDIAAYKAKYQAKYEANRAARLHQKGKGKKSETQLRPLRHVTTNIRTLAEPKE